MQLAQRSITSSAFNITSNIIQVIILFARSVVLTRVLSPATYGEYVLIASIIGLSQTIPDFGLHGAFLYKSSNKNVEGSLRTHFTLSFGFSLSWLVLVYAAAFIFAPVGTRWIYLYIATLSFFPRLTNTPKSLLTRNVDFKRLAIIDTIESILASIVAIGMALLGFGIWSLLAPRILDVLVQVLGIYGFKPVWKPKFGWNKEIARDFLQFGAKAFQGSVFLNALDQVDDIWTGIFLGKTALGFYDRAYKFANYPRKFLSAPIIGVAVGTYAQVKDDRQRLSKAFSLINLFLIRVNFIFAGILALIAPEFIRIVIGVKWIPMLDVFRLMIIYTLLDPIKLTIANVIIAAGYPEKVVRIRFIQFIVMLVGLIILPPIWDISGVAIAVDLMLLVGIVALLMKAREFVDYSFLDLFLVPTIGLGTGMVLARLAILIPGVLGSDWRTAAVKIAVFSITYFLIMLVFERKSFHLVNEILQNYIRTVFHKGSTNLTINNEIDSNQ